jgi:glycosyltransferase involved in cell wall biosynthesis
VKTSAPRVAIGLPVYKAGKWISACLDSLLKQTLIDFEIVISDNCSPDDTVEICEAYARRDPRIRVLRQTTNLGVAGNHNATLQQTTSEFFCWASANDLYAPTFLERCVAVLESDPEIVLTGPRASSFHEVPGDGELLAEHPLADVRDPSRRLYAVMSSMKHSRIFRGMYRRSAMPEPAPLRPVFGTDHLLVVRLSLIGRLVHIDEPLYFERVSPGARTASVPLHLRARHYEPSAGIRCIVFHRVRLLAHYWRMALRHAQGSRQRLAVFPSMLRVMYDQRSMVFNDVVEFSGLLRGLLSSRRPSPASPPAPSQT